MGRPLGLRVGLPCLPSGTPGGLASLMRWAQRQALKVPKSNTAVRHHAALHYSEVGAALRRIDSGASLAKLAGRFIVLTVNRR